MSGNPDRVHGRWPQGHIAPSCANACQCSEGLEYLVVGRVAAPHGVHGELRVALETEDPNRFQSLARVFLGEQHQPFEVKGARLHKGQVLLSLSEIPDRNAAERWRGAWVYVSAEDALPLDEDQYYYHQIIGLEVVTEEGETLGRVVEIIATGANDVYVVRGGERERLLPAIGEVILRVDLGAGRLTVRLPAGLD